MSIIKNFLNSRGSNPQREMGFLDHVDELRIHIIRSAFAILIAAILVFTKVEWIFDHIILGPTYDDFISYRWFCAMGRFFHYDAFCLGKIDMRFQNTAVTGQFMMSMSVSLMLGFIVAFPYVLWQLWKFIKPALKPSEVKMAKGIVFWCSLLFFVGVAFAYLIVAPYTINFFGNYKLSPKFENIITIDNYYETMSNMVIALGIVFELPMLIYFLSRIGILTPKFLREKRRYAFVILFILSEIITPPDLFSALLVFIPLYILFEVSVLISGRANKQKALRDALKDKE